MNPISAIDSREFDIQDEVRALDLGSKIRQLRQKKRLTLQNVSDLTGLSKALLSQIENNNAAPPIATLLKISRALNVSIGYFFREDEPDQRIEVTRHDDSLEPSQRRHHLFETVGYTYKSLAQAMAEKHMDPFLIEIEAMDEDALQFFGHVGEEFLFVLNGEVEFRGAERVIALSRGDSIYFDSQIPHALRALGDGPARALVVVFSR